MALGATLDHALGRLTGPLAGLLPRRLRRVADRIERRRTRPFGQWAAAGFLLATILYGLAVGGQLGRVADSALVVLGFGIENIRISGHAETSESGIIEKLAFGGSLLSFDVREAEARLGTLPWVADVTVRKFYPRTLAVEIEEREGFALWQQEGQVFVIDRSGGAIVQLEDARYGDLPFTVGDDANRHAAAFLDAISSEPELARQMRAAVFVAGRRWDLHLDNGVTVRLPEKDVAAALAQLVKLDAERQLLSRDVVVVDLRLADRVTVRLPEGRSLEEVTSPDQDAAAAPARART